MQVNAEQFTNNGTQLALDRVIEFAVPNWVKSTRLRQDQQREMLSRAHMRKQLAAPTTCALRSTVDQMLWIEPEGFDHPLRYRGVLISAGMARRSERNHLVIKREAGLICRSQHSHCGKRLHGATQRDQSIWLADACSKAASACHYRHVATMCRLRDLATLHHRNHRWWRAVPDANAAHARPRALSTSVRPRSITSNAKSSSSFVMMSGGFVKKPFHRTIV